MSTLSIQDDTQVTQTISVVYAQPYEQRIVTLAVMAGTSVFEAVKQSQIERFFIYHTLDDMSYALFGKLIKDPSQAMVQTGDRIELCGALRKQGTLKHIAKKS